MLYLFCFAKCSTVSCKHVCFIVTSGGCFTGGGLTGSMGNMFSMSGKCEHLSTSIDFGSTVFNFNTIILHMPLTHEHCSLCLKLMCSTEMNNIKAICFISNKR